MNDRPKFEAAVGAVITRFNDVEVAMIEMIISLLRDRQRGEIVGWALGFQAKIRVVASLSRTRDNGDIWSNDLHEALKRAKYLYESVRNLVAHHEMWENPFAPEIAFRKVKVTQKGSAPTWSHLDSTDLQTVAEELGKLAQKIDVLAHDAWINPDELEDER